MKDETVVPKIRVIGEMGAILVNEKIRVSMPDDILREKYKLARKVGLIGDNKEVCERIGMPYNNFEVWLSDPRHRLTEPHRSYYVRWWNEDLIQRPPNIVGYLFNTLSPKSVSWSITFEQAMEQAEKSRVLCVQTPENKLVGVLTYKDSLEIYEDLKEDHISFKRSLEELISLRYIPYNFREMRWDTPVNSEVVNDLRRGVFVVVNDEKGEIESFLPPFPKILSYAPSLAHAETYSSSQLPIEVANVLRKTLEKNPICAIRRESMKVIDVGTGPGTFALTLGSYYQEQIGEGKLFIKAVEREEEVHFRKELDRRIVQRNLKQVIFPEFKGVGNLTKYGEDYDLVVWNLAYPTRDALQTFPAILKVGGIVAISYYASETMNEINRILISALGKRMRCLPEPKLKSVFRSQTLSLSRIARKILRSGIKKKFLCSRPVTGRFEDARSFLEFWHCASPLVCGVLSSFDEYPMLRDRIFEFVENEIASSYGKRNIEKDFFVNIVIGQKKKA